MKITIFALMFFTAAASAETVDITYDRLKSMLEQKNEKIEASKLELQAAKERQGSLARSFLPTIELYGAQENFKMGRQANKTQPAYGAELKINLFNGGKDQIHSEIQNIAAEKNVIQVTRVSSQELQSARNLYWQIIYSQEQIELIESTNLVNNQNLAVALKRIRSGVATESDRYEFEMKSTDLKRDLGEEKLRLLNLKKEFNVVLNLNSSDELRFPDKLTHEHEFEEVLKHTATDHEFLYKESELKSRASFLNAKSQNKEWWPKLDLYAGYNQWNEREEEYSHAKDRTETVAGLRLSLSLRTGLEGKREATAFNYEAQGLKKLADYKKKEVEVHVKSELSELRLRHDQVHDAEENIKRAEKYYKLTQSEYSRGVKNSPDVLGASDKLFEMKHKRLVIIRDFQISKAHVLAKIGR